MCVAIYKPTGATMPTLETLEQCWLANPDGAGFAIESQKNPKFKYEIHKGFMSWDAFVKAYQQYDLANYKGVALLHFRIATHGGVNAGNCHPFPICNDNALLKTQDVLTNTVLIHNGVLPITPSSPDISDTMELCRLLHPFANRLQEAGKLIEELLGSNKVAILSENQVSLLGTWTPIDGVYYSNTHWQYKSVSFNGGYPMSSYAYEDDYAYDDDDDPYWVQEQLDCLENMICPYCGEAVIKDITGYWCPDCRMAWDMAQIKSYKKAIKKAKKGGKKIAVNATV